MMLFQATMNYGMLQCKKLAPNRILLEFSLKWTLCRCRPSYARGFATRLNSGAIDTMTSNVASGTVAM